MIGVNAVVDHARHYACARILARQSFSGVYLVYAAYETCTVKFHVDGLCEAERFHGRV